MKKFVLILILCILLSGCRPIELPETVTEPEPDINIEYETQAPETLYNNNDGRKIICVDAGHGFDDVGCGPYLMGCYEKEVTIKAAKYLKVALEELGAEVILTHDGETYPDEKDIIAAAERHGITLKEEGIKENNIFSAYERGIYEEILARDEAIDFFISLHVNSVENASYVDGYELYYCKDNPNGILLSQFGQNLSEVLDNDISVEATAYEDSYIVTKYSKIPSVLLEMGYATNPQDAKNMTSDAWLQNLARTLAAEIVNIVEN
ncbi:MAG: N-acetylmuramoyl-L-alanine amidase [Clostridia bacterium]|nr:N-acetylmuramoyl-L-alanine amidase [Clostridia bacterium]